MDQLPLTDAERTVLRGLGQGVPSQEVAAEAGLTVAELGELLRGISRKNPVRSERFLRLSPREWTVLLAIAEGGTNAQIALLLCISQRHVGNLVSAVFAKIDAASRADATGHFVRWLAIAG